MTSLLTNWIMTAASILTAFGIFMHDGRLDAVVITGTDMPLDSSHIARSDHIHTDYNVNESLLNNSFAYQSAGVPPKGRSERKHRLTLPAQSFGRHAFDDGLLPAVG